MAKHPTSKSPSGSKKNASDENQQQSRESNVHQGQSRPRPHSDNPELLVQILIDVAKKLWLQIRKISSFIMVELGGYQLFDKLAQWAVRHPHISICLLAGSVVTILPFLVLLGFGLSTIVMTFTGFLVLEGTLLSLVSIMLFSCLGALAIVFVFFAIVGVATYFGFARIYDLYGGGMRTALNKFLQNENLQQGNQNHVGGGEHQEGSRKKQQNIYADMEISPEAKNVKS